jgi:hypothetical protein
MTLFPACPVPGCHLQDEAAHRRYWAHLDATVGRSAANAFDDRHAAWLECDDCGRTDGTHDHDVEH